MTGRASASGVRRRRPRPARPDDRPGPRLVDRCQVVRYHADTEAEARRLAEDDVDAAARAGFVADDAGWWGEEPERPELVVTYRYSLPASITRSVLTLSSMAEGVAAVDADEMATAGYVPAHRDWQGTSSGGKGLSVGGPAGAFGASGQGWLIMEYRHAPDLFRGPLRAVALADERGRTGWWVLDDPTFEVG